MLSLLDIAERAQNGPKMDEDTWNMNLFKKMEDLRNRYEIEYSGAGSFFNRNEDLVERVFEAGIDFLTQMGMYCVTTRRVIEVSAAEIHAALAEVPEEIVVGEGRDARTIRQFQHGRGQRLNHIPGLHAPWSEELAPLIVKNYAQIATADLLEGFSFRHVDGRPIHGIVSEAYASKREAAWMREGIRKAGRPGMAIAYYPINTRASTLIAPIDAVYGIRPTDGLLLSTLPNTKVELDLLTAAAVYDEYGCFKINGGAGAFIGTFCGGAEGAIIESIVNSIAGWLVYRDELTAVGLYDVRQPVSPTMNLQPEKLWGCSVVLQTLRQKTNFICLDYLFSGQSGPGTELHLLETGIQGITSAINGAHIWISRQHRARMNASQTPVETEFMYEIANATLEAGLGSEAGDAILKRLTEQINGRSVDNGTDDIRTIYDLVYHRPTDEYRLLYENVKKIFKEAGFPF